MHFKGKYTWLKHFDFMLLDLFSLMIAFVLSYTFKFHSFDIFIHEEWGYLFFIVCFVNLIISLFANPYSGILRRGYYDQFIKEIPLLFYQMASVFIIFYMLKIGVLFSRIMLFTMYIIYFVIAHGLKYWRKRRLLVKNSKDENKTKVLVICDKENAENVVHNVLVGDVIKFDVTGVYLIDTEFEDSVINDIPVINDYTKCTIGEVFIAVNPALVSQEMYKYFFENGIGINFDIESIVGFETEDSTIQRVGNYKTLSVGVYNYDPSKVMYFIVKRIFDIACGLLGILLIIPCYLVIKTCYMFSGDFKPIFYTQRRVGKDGKIINLYKFRSMVPNAEEVLQEMLKDEKYRLEWEENQKFENDPRITKVGRIIRKLSIDEVPQFLNVLKGEMSLIGPRPLVEGELEAHNGLKLYNKVKPGITGWWACNGRSNIEYRERLQLEYYYIENCSFSLDITCILRTILAVIRKDGAQ